MSQTSKLYGHIEKLRQQFFKYQNTAMQLNIYILKTLNLDQPLLTEIPCNQFPPLK